MTSKVSLDASLTTSSFREERAVPTRKVRCFPNNKPWINRDIKVLLNRKRAFMAAENGIA